MRKVIGEWLCKAAIMLDGCNIKEEVMSLTLTGTIETLGAGMGFYRMMRDHALAMPERERVAYLVRMLWKSKYGWGKEIIGDVDCSGSVCFALYLMGYNIRTTAHGIYTHLCGPHLVDPKPGDLAFWWHETEERIRHVAVFSDNKIIMNASTAFEDIPYVTEELRRHQRGQAAEVRSLDFERVVIAAKSGNHVYGVDTELKPLFGAFGE